MRKGIKILFAGVTGLAAGGGGAYLYGPERSLELAQRIARRTLAGEQQPGNPNPAPPPEPAAPPASVESPPPARTAHFGHDSGLEDKTRDGFVVRYGFIKLMHPEGFADGLPPVLSQQEFDSIVGESRKKIVGRYRVRALDETGEIGKAAKELKNDPDRAGDFTLTLSVPFYVRKAIRSEIETRLRERGIALAENPSRPPVDVMFEGDKLDVNLSSDDVRKLTGMKKPAVNGPKPRR